ncbi:hypothetical protein B0H13DRAFT_1899723 [Mycena leptocephala]|nr:hypothetical protein B0H13DRAFT_1899723 [Mycena leptocephala]
MAWVRGPSDCRSSRNFTSCSRFSHVLELRNGLAPPVKSMLAGLFYYRLERKKDVVGGQAVLIAEGGARVEQGNEAENAEAETAAAAAAKSKKKRKAARISFADALEAKFLSRFACTTACRRIIWDERRSRACTETPRTTSPVDTAVAGIWPASQLLDKRDGEDL